MNTITKKNKIITMRISDKVEKELEFLSLELDRSKSYIAEQALIDFIKERSWLIKEAKIGLKEVEHGKLVNEKEMELFFKKLRSDIKKSK